MGKLIKQWLNQWIKLINKWLKNTNWTTLKKYIRIWNKLLRKNLNFRKWNFTKKTRTWKFLIRNKYSLRINSKIKRRKTRIFNLKYLCYSR